MNANTENILWGALIVAVTVVVVGAESCTKLSITKCHEIRLEALKNSSEAVKVLGANYRCSI